MKLAINYSETAESLVQNGQIKIDLFKCADIPWLIKKASRVLPVTVHFNLYAGDRSLPNTDWSAVHQFFQNTQTLYINLHLEPTSKHHGDIPIDSGEPKNIEKIVERILDEIQPVTKRFRDDQILFENAIYRRKAGKALRAAVEPDVFHMIMNEIDCGLLLDISHARISARNLGIDEHEYISNLPVHKLREIHFTGLHYIDGKWIDHLPILDEDWLVLEWVKTEIDSGNFANPWLFVFEYGGVGDKYINRCDPDVIVSQVPRLRQILGTQ